MKKILLSVLILLLLILAYFAIDKGIKFLDIKSVKDIKQANSNLENNFNESNTLSNKTYPEELDGLEEAIKKLKISKQNYENKNLYTTEGVIPGDIEIKTYKIHYLWTILGNYRKDRGVQVLNLDLQSTNLNDVYDLQFTINGSYTSITDFIYDIENDEELNFEIKNFILTSTISDFSQGNEEQKEETTQNNILLNRNDKEEESTDKVTTDKKGDGITLQAKFTVESVGITLD